MSAEGYLNEIRAYLSENFGGVSSKISDEEPLLGDVLDSIGVLSLATHLEQTYGITIGAHEMDPENFGTLSALAQFVARKCLPRRP